MIKLCDYKTGFVLFENKRENNHFYGYKVSKIGKTRYLGKFLDYFGWKY